MSCQDMDPDGAFLAGGFNGWGDTPMIDAGMEIWTAEVQFHTGDAFDWEYKFKNGLIGWETTSNRQLTIDDSYPIMVLPVVMFNDETCEPTDVDIPEVLSLSQNYPNPFNPTTNIDFAIREPGNVQLAVYNVAGQMVGMLANGNYAVGQHTVTFDASELSSGVYFYTLSTQNESLSRKMILVK